MEITAHLRKLGNETNITKLDFSIIPQSTNKITVEINDKHKDLFVKHTLFIDKDSRKGDYSYPLIQILSDEYLLFYDHVSNYEEITINVINEKREVSIYGLPLKDYDRIMVNDLCYNVQHIVIGKEIIAVTQNGGITLDRFKEI
jgi:hypothetical protein